MMCEGRFSDACLVLPAGEDRGYSAARDHCFSNGGAGSELSLPIPRRT